MVDVLGVERLPMKRMRGVRALERAMVTRMIIIVGRRSSGVGGRWEVKFRVVRK